MHEKNEEIIINDFMRTYSTTQKKQGIYKMQVVKTDAK